jgi:hypothetical protein
MGYMECPVSTLSSPPSISTVLQPGKKAPDFNVNFFLSGSMGRADWHEERLLGELQCRLCSCHDNYVRDAKRWAELVSRPDNQVRYFMLDSGAFTGWKSNHPVVLTDLIRIYGEVMALVDQKKVKVFLINLDVIPGSPGVTATAEVVDAAIKQSDINFNILSKEFGDCVIPVYHQNESEARLHEVLAMSDYICASPRNDLPEWTRVKWSEEVHQKLPAGKRTHGLATTGTSMLTRVPWWSVDSASWLFSGVMGKVDCWHEGNWVSINISKESPDRYNQGKHFNNCDRHIQQVVEERATFHGITVDQLRDDHMSRKLLNGLEIIEWLKVFKYEAKEYQPALFDL